MAATLAVEVDSFLCSELKVSATADVDHLDWFDVCTADVK